MEKPSRFNLRVYGLLRNDAGAWLVAHESIKDYSFTKFPGGGLEFGEGPEDCLVREYLEETGLTITIMSHFYTTGFYQPSAFNPSDQLISIYYIVSCVSPEQLPMGLIEVAPGHHIRFEWVPSESLNQELLTFPVDRYVAGLVKEKCF
jgi:8-oxo-dGTP pyrophosphatase MutT (NUDIX family)